MIVLTVLTIVASLCGILLIYPKKVVPETRREHLIIYLHGFFFSQKQLDSLKLYIIMK